MKDLIKEYLKQIGSKGGKVKSPAKRKAAKANGKKGGRPKTRGLKIALLLIALGFSTGCNSLDRLINGREHTEVSAPVINPAPSNKPIKTVVLAGQSQASNIFYAASSHVRTEITKKFDVSVNIVNCAVGGSAIASWSEGSPNLNACIQKLANEPEVIGVIFWQGETEAGEGPTNTWTSGFESFVSGIRSSLNKSNLPIAYGRLSNNMTAGITYLDEIRAQQESVNLFNVRMVSLDGLTTGSDGLHFEGQAIQEAGTRLSAALAQTIQ